MYSVARDSSRQVDVSALAYTIFATHSLSIGCWSGTDRVSIRSRGCCTSPPTLATRAFIPHWFISPSRVSCCSLPRSASANMARHGFMRKEPRNDSAQGISRVDPRLLLRLAESSARSLSPHGSILSRFVATFPPLPSTAPPQVTARPQSRRFHDPRHARLPGLQRARAARLHWYSQLPFGSSACIL